MSERLKPTRYVFLIYVSAIALESLGSCATQPKIIYKEKESCRCLWDDSEMMWDVKCCPGGPWENFDDYIAGDSHASQ